ncbi:kelch-like protein 12 [Adelges cooleyi]|uniref:kelch-like protein 12 n=1 Tax=Adelges cooleyi TaxID=133065 RepID=UPI00217FAA8D|nr:kelch-like protein 12 [Adelges cooleyi]XP_050444326.1 kelch-like protein 12 [Adelges cooleyi]
MPNARNSCSSIIHNSCLYVFGGSDGKNFSSIVDCYNLQKEHWTQCNPMPTATATTGITSRGNDLYLFGGIPYSTSKGAYKMNLNNSKWDTLPDMIKAKMYANAVTIENDLFVVGKNINWRSTKNEKRPEVVFCERYIAEKNT